MINGTFNTLPLYSRGADQTINKRLCLEAHDDYFNCLDDQKTDKVNKYLCMDPLYLFETYCDSNFIKFRKHRYLQLKSEEKIFTQDKLDLINIKRSLVGVDKKLANGANFENPILNNLKLE